MKPLTSFFSKALATCFFLTYPLARWAVKSGRRHCGAGFVGTLAGLASVKILPTDPWRAVLVVLGAFFVSVAVSDHAEALFGKKDDQRIVIDEWAGYLVSVALLPKTPVILLSGFVLFRVIDVLKPVGIDRLGRLPGGWGVVMDDVACGLAVNVILRLLPL